MHLMVKLHPFFSYKMSSAISFTKIILVLLMNVTMVKDLQSQDQCIWVCDDKVNRVEDVVGTHEQIYEIFNFSKRVHQNCTDDTTVVSWNFITVGIIVAVDTSIFSFSHFLTFGIEHVSLRQFLFGNKNTDLESVNNSVSCLLRPLSTETGRGASNGLDVLHSPLFYLRNSVTSSSKNTPYVGFVEIGETFYLSAGFTDSTTPEYRLKFDHWDWAVITILSTFLVVVFTLFNPSILTLFCANIKTVQIERLSVEEGGVDPCSKATRSPSEHEEPIESVVDRPRVNLDSNHDILSAAANRDSGKEFLTPSVAAKRGESKETRIDLPSWVNDDLGLGSSLAAPKHGAPGIGTRLPNQENNSSDGHSEMVAGLPRTVPKLKNPPSTVPEFSQTRSGGTSVHGASGSSFMEDIEPNKPQTAVQHQNIKNRKLDDVEKNPPSTVPEFSQTRSGGTSVHGASGSSFMEETEPNKPQTAVQHQNIKNRKLDDVEVMDVGSPASPVGLISFIANNVFSNSESLSLPYQFVKFVMLIMFPLFIPMLIDVFVLAIPRLFPRIGNNLPSPFLTKTSFFFTYEVCPGFMYFCLFWNIIRMGCFCFSQSSSNWVPSFLWRKYFFCFLYSQLVLPNNSQSAYDECKKAPEVIPVNIKNNLGFIFSLDFFHKNWKDLYPRFQQSWLLQGNGEAGICKSLGKGILLFLCGLVSFLLFIALLAVDIVASLPAISLGYGRVWFILDWAEKSVKIPYLQFGCLVGEFLVIVLSIVWIVYFSFCCSLSLALALLQFYIAGVNCPVEILLSVACYIIVGLIFWTCYYNSYTKVYKNLLQKLKETCSKDHAGELNRYKEGDVINIPRKLFTFARDKLRPKTGSLQTLFFRLIFLVVILLIVFSFSMGSNADVSASKVLTAIVTFLVCLYTLVSFLWSSSEQEWEDLVLKDHVDAYFKGKLD